MESYNSDSTGGEFDVIRHFAVREYRPSRISLVLAETQFNMMFGRDSSILDDEIELHCGEFEAPNTGQSFYDVGD